jgi:hypothetical protein
MRFSFLHHPLGARSFGLAIIISIYETKSIRIAYACLSMVGNVVLRR